MKNCICILTVLPSFKWLNFLQKITQYDIYIITDNNRFDYNLIYNDQYPNIQFIQVADEDCESHYFINSNSTHEGFNKIISWDRALHYFSNVNTIYDNVWFIEEDVYFHNEKTIRSIDVKYETSDLLSPPYGVNEKGQNKDWVWPIIDMHLDPPYYNAILCAIRMSKKMMCCINAYVKQIKTLVFIEALIPTLAKKYNFIYDTPNELKSITHRQVWNTNDLNKTDLFHPVKNLAIHDEMREKHT